MYLKTIDRFEGRYISLALSSFEGIDLAHTLAVWQYLT